MGRGKYFQRSGDEWDTCFMQSMEAVDLPLVVMCILGKPFIRKRDNLKLRTRNSPPQYTICRAWDSAGAVASDAVASAMTPMYSGDRKD